MTEQHQSPVRGKADTLEQLTAIVTHPAFRIGFLDAQSGKPLEHDSIVMRIQAETPATALKRLGWDWLGWMKPMPRDVEIAQYRYEEGRLAVLVLGLKCKAWGHPDFPPAQVRKKIEQMAKDRTQ